jgi:hypothetical protein
MFHEIGVIMKVSARSRSDYVICWGDRAKASCEKVEAGFSQDASLKTYPSREEVEIGFSQHTM